MVPKNLTTEQKANRKDVCLDLLDRLEREPEFFSRVITGDRKDYVNEKFQWHHLESNQRPSDL